MCKNSPPPADQCEIIIYYTKEDGDYVAEEPELPGCPVGAPIREAALAAAAAEIVDWITDAQKTGVAIPEPSGRIPFAVE
jgi:predicted RNase H-like HicB family nuclease